MVAAARLVRWLGPWAGARSPTEPTRDTLRLGGDLRAHLYQPPARRRVLGAYLLVPGLHHDGPDDPRMDRLARVFADAGLVVLAPFLRDHLGLLASAAAAEELGVAFARFDDIARDHGVAPSVFSVSFGCLPAITMCADPRFAARVHGLFVYGGYVDFVRVCRFAALGEGAGRRFDPTNAPAVFVNLAAHLALPAGDRRALVEAWRAFCRLTWNRPELRDVAALHPIGGRLAADLPIGLRSVFLDGCGLGPGARALLDELLERAAPSFTFADPRPSLARLRAPVVIAHGRDDGVIPVDEAHHILAALPAGHPARLYITGLFGHGESHLPTPSAVAAEVRTLLAMVRAMITLPAGETHVSLG